MKISIKKPSQIFSAVVTAFAVSIMVAGTPVGAINAKLAVDNQTQDIEAIVKNIQKELENRSSNLEDSAGSLNGQGSGGTGSSALGSNAKECAGDNAKTQNVVKTTNAQSHEAFKNTQDLIGKAQSVNSLDGAKSLAQDVETTFAQYKNANTQNNVMNGLCTIQSSAKKVTELNKKADTKAKECKSKGFEIGKVFEIIEKIFQLIEAVLAIFASAMALMQAAQGLAGGGGGNPMQMIQGIQKILPMIQTIIKQIITAIELLIEIFKDIADVISSLSCGGDDKKAKAKAKS